MSLAARGCVVTGGGRGIGAAVARALAHQGARVVVAARSEEQIEGTAAALRGTGGQAWAVACDVTSPAEVDALAGRAGDLLGHVDIVVNGAGVATSAPLARTSLEEWNRLLAVNATGPFLVTRAFLPAMIESRWGRIVNIASTAALRGARYISAYAASKHALLGLTRSAAAEAAPSGVTVNAVCPGYVDTAMTEESIERIKASTGLSAERALAMILEQEGQQRLITPEEVAARVVWLCGDAASSINGQAIAIDGG